MNELISYLLLLCAGDSGPSTATSFADYCAKVGSPLRVADSVVVDVGSGCGILLQWLSHYVQQAVGFEIDSLLHKQAQHVLLKFMEWNDCGSRGSKGKKYSRFPENVYHFCKDFKDTSGSTILVGFLLLLLPFTNHTTTNADGSDPRNQLLYCVW